MVMIMMLFFFILNDSDDGTIMLMINVDESDEMVHVNQSNYFFIN